MPNTSANGPSAVVACIGLGGNVGDAAGALVRAFDALAQLPGTHLLRRSQLYRTPAWGRADQPNFVNAAAVVSTVLSAAHLLEALLGIERGAGRDRANNLPRWSPRTLDLDLLLYGESVIAQPGLHVPHPHLHERAFVLVPLAEIAADACVPGHGRVGALREAIDASGIFPLTAGA